jgi:hypothetical protein
MGRPPRLLLQLSHWVRCCCWPSLLRRLHLQQLLRPLVVRARS